MTKPFTAIQHTFPFVLFNKTWVKYVPNFEGYYAISTDGFVLSLNRNIIDKNNIVKQFKSKLLKIGKNTHSYILHKNGISTYYTINQIYEMLHPKPSVISFPMKFENEILLMWYPNMQGYYAITNKANIVQIKNQHITTAMRFIKMYNTKTNCNVFYMWHNKKQTTITKNTIKKILTENGFKVLDL